jgi:hypothetical protein
LYKFGNSVGEAPLGISVCGSKHNRMWLTPWIRVLLEKLAVSQQVKKFLTFYRTRRFSTTLTTARHLFLYWARWIQSKPPSSICRMHLNTVLPLFQAPPHRNPGWVSAPSYTCHMALLSCSCLITLIIFDKEYKSWTLLSIGILNLCWISHTKGKIQRTKQTSCF